MDITKLAASRFQALASALLASGNGVSTVDYIPPTGASITFSADATQAQVSAANSTVQGWDWSQAAEDAYQVTATRNSALVNVVSKDPTFKVIRAVALTTYDLVTTTMTTVNQVVAFVNTKGGTITPLTIPTWAQFVNSVKGKISGGSAD